MNGKLYGVMPTQTPTGWRTASASTSPAMFGSISPMMRLGMPQANSTTSMPRLHLGPGLGERLAVLARDERGELFEVLFQQRAEAEHEPGPLDDRRFAPGRQRGGRRLDDFAGFVRPSQNGTRAITWPVDGLKTSPQRLVAQLDPFAAARGWERFRCSESWWRP